MKHPDSTLEGAFSAELVRDSHVVVGFSGGADSMALLHYLFEKQEALSLTVEAAHLNHGLRGEESDRDEETCRVFCAERGILLHVLRLDINAMALECRQSLEECGREARYNFFEDCRKKAEKSGQTILIATAHTLTDNLETVLFHLIRGTGLDGLCGIPASRGAVIRPLLNCSREQVEDYCNRKGLSYVTDSSNLEPVYTRNKIRLELLPRLYALNPYADSSFLRMLQTLLVDRDYLAEETEKLLQTARCPEGFSIAPLGKAPEALRTRAAIAIFKQWGLSYDWTRAQELSTLLKNGRGQMNIGRERWISTKGGLLFLKQQEPETPYFEATVPDFEKISAKCQEITLFSETNFGENHGQTGKKIYLQVISAKSFLRSEKIYKNLLSFYVDYDTIIGSLKLRQKLPGDRLSLWARGVSKPLKKLLNEAGIPPAERNRLLVLADDEGVVWLEGFGVDGRVLLKQETKWVLIGGETPLMLDDTREKGMGIEDENG